MRQQALEEALTCLTKAIEADMGPHSSELSRDYVRQAVAKSKILLDRGDKSASVAREFINGRV